MRSLSALLTRFLDPGRRPASQGSSHGLRRRRVPDERNWDSAKTYSGAYISTPMISYKGGWQPQQRQVSRSPCPAVAYTYIQYPRMIPQFNHAITSYTNMKLGNYGGKQREWCVLCFRRTILDRETTLTITAEELYTNGGFLTGTMSTNIYCTYINNIFLGTLKPSVTTTIR